MLRISDPAEGETIWKFLNLLNEHEHKHKLYETLCYVLHEYLLVCLQ